MCVGIWKLCFNVGIKDIWHTKAFLFNSYYSFTNKIFSYLFLLHTYNFLFFKGPIKRKTLAPLGFFVLFNIISILYHLLKRFYWLVVGYFKVVITLSYWQQPISPSKYWRRCKKKLKIALTFSHFKQYWIERKIIVDLN